MSKLLLFKKIFSNVFAVGHGSVYTGTHADTYACILCSGIGLPDTLQMSVHVGVMFISLCKMEPHANSPPKVSHRLVARLSCFRGIFLCPCDLSSEVLMMWLGSGQIDAHLSGEDEALAQSLAISR
jgi:hypothetical protein